MNKYALLLCLLPSSALAADEWTPVACVPLDLPPEAMFDVVRVVDDFEGDELAWKSVPGEQYAKVELRRDMTVTHDSKAAMRLDYEFVGKPGLEYILFNRSLEIPEAGHGFGFWMRNDGESLPTRLRIVDASGETHQIELISADNPGWQFVAGSLDGVSTSWGGDGNGHRDYPCRLVGICLDRPRQGFVGKGSLWIDDVALLRARELPNTMEVEVKDARFGNLYAIGETVNLRFRGEAGSTVSTVENFWGLSSRYTLTFGEETALSWRSTQLSFPRPGYYEFTLELHRDGRPAEIQKFCCAAIADGAEAARSDFVGVCSHYGQNNYPLPSMDLMQAYGIDQFRDEISWRSYERERGRYEMPAHAAAYLEHARKLKMRPLIIYDYNNPLYDNDGFPNSPEAIDAFAAYAVDLTRQTRGVVNMFEVWNEWIGGCGMNGRPGDHDAEAYGRLMNPTYEAVKQAFPDVTVVGIGGEYGKDCAENVAKVIETAGVDSMDAWSIHPYRYPHSPEKSDLVGEVKRIAQRVKETGAELPAWVTEIGYPTHRTSGGSTEADQARHCVRTLALLQSTGKVDKVFWYDFKDDGTRRDYNEHNFGLVHHQSYNCAPKPAAVAMSVFIRMTGGAKFRELRRLGPAYLVYYDLPDGREVVMAWTEGDWRNLPVSGQLEKVVNIMGAEEMEFGSVRVMEDPCYWVGRDLKIGR